MRCLPHERRPKDHGQGRRRLFHKEEEERSETVACRRGKSSTLKKGFFSAWKLPHSKGNDLLRRSPWVISLTRWPAMTGGQSLVPPEEGRGSIPTSLRGLLYRQNRLCPRKKLTMTRNWQISHLLRLSSLPQSQCLDSSLLSSSNPLSASFSIAFFILVFMSLYSLSIFLNVARSISALE